MPSRLKAGGTFPYILEADRGDGPDPQFSIQVLSAFDDGEIASIRAEYIAATGQPAKRAELLSRALAISVSGCHIAGWSVDSLTKNLTSLESWELINAATEGASLTAEQRKKYVLPSPSETDCSAETADRETVSSK
jgi:hypothetical protein